MHAFASDLLIDRLADWGVETVFGVPGDGADGVLGAFRRRADRLHLVRAQHEEAAAFMATAYAKSSGRIGVCLATSPAGALHLLAGLYDAKLDHQPLLAITESEPSYLLGTAYPQQVRLQQVLDDVADYNVTVRVPVQIPAVVDIAVGHAMARGTVSHVTFPHDLSATATDSSPWVMTTPSRAPNEPLFTRSPGLPQRDELERAAAVLNRGERVVMLVGSGALGAGKELMAVAEALASPIVKSLPGKAVVPDDHPLTTGCGGTLGTGPSRDALERADTVFMVGTNFPVRACLPDAGRTRTVSLQTDLSRAGTDAFTDLTLTGDAAATLDALLPLLEPSTTREALEEVRAAMVRWRRYLAGLEAVERAPVQPQYLVRRLDELASPDAILATDSGVAATWAARHYDVRAGRGFLVSANLASMPAGLPYAIAAQWANPERQCVAFVGSDGFTGLMGELLTASHYRLPVKVVVANTSAATARLRATPRRAAPADLAAWARACGALGLRVERANQVDPALRAAFEHAGPALVDVLVNPDERPCPPPPARG